ncbi:hypothetical protein [Aliarcobacter butzleri]|uniref:hypothetical protein n=1 Tax=Aliarcobacter butzleri TaxID=28197 RepID=UPI002B2430F6|nr:hypothetical protein [Aliarcobacter butzleri]
MANSLGFWANQQIETQIHFNLWKLPYKKKKRDEDYKHFLDIGLLLKSNTDNTDLTIKIFIPFHIEKKDFFDLSSTIKDKHLLNAIFNRPLSYKKSKLEGSYFIKDEKNNSQSFFMKTLDNIIINKLKDQYSEIIINVDKRFLESRDLYLRFRLNLFKEKFSTYVQDNDYFLKTAYKKEELVEFRINELRNLSDEIQDIYTQNTNKIKITQLHYFLVRGNDANLVLSHKPFKRCRSVEHNIWQRYINDKNCDLKDNKSILSYHWSELSDVIEHYGAFAKFSYTRSDRLILYFFIFVILTITLELIANGIYDLITETNNAIIDVFAIILMLTLSIPCLYYLSKIGYYVVREILKFLKFIICCPKSEGD